MSRGRKLVYIITIVILIGLIFGLLRQTVASLQGGNRIDAETEELLVLQKKNVELKQKLDEVRSIEFIEKIARDKLNLARPGETVIVISDEAVNRVLKSWEEKKEIKLPNWQGWLNLFSH